MPEPAPNAELLRSLGRLVRGLSALFWGLPIALIVCVESGKTEMLRPFNVIPPLVVTAWLCAGLWLLGAFQKQERIWRNALDRSKILALVNFGLSPFLYWWSQMPNQPFFALMVNVMGATGLIFLGSVNLVLCRLSAMLPDEGLRQETRHFTTLNRYLVLAILCLDIVLIVLRQHPSALSFAPLLLYLLSPASPWLMVFPVLLPLAMTMALIWKIKEVILDSVFGPGR